MFYHHEPPFQVMMLSSYPSNLFLLSRRGTPRDKGECPVDITSLCNLHNAIASFRFKNSSGGDLAKEAAFRNLQPNWSLYQRKYAARIDFMKQAPRIHPVITGKEIFSLPSSCALLGTLSDLTVGGKTDKACSSFTCALRPERDNGSPPLAFAEAYSRRCVTYNNTNLAKITVDQLINFQILVRMEIQFLAGWDVEWRPSSGKVAAGGEVSAAHDSQSEEGEAVAAAAENSESQTAAGNLSLLQSIATTTAAGSFAEERLLRYALHVSKQDLTSLNGEECHRKASSPAALHVSKQDLTSLNGEECHRKASSPAAGPQSLDSTEVEGDISDIVNWGYSRGDFPLTPQGLQLMEFDHKKHTSPPKYVFPAAILLFVCAKRSEAEEAAFQRLSEAWRYWFDNPLSYAFLKDDPPLRLNLNHEEIEWCKVKLEYLVKQISSDSDRERLGLPTTKRSARAKEAALLLPGSKSIPDSNPAPRDDFKAGTSANAAPAPRAAAAASGSESVNGGGGIAEEDSGGNVEKTVRGKRAKSAGAEGAPTAAKRARLAREFKGGSPVKDEDKTTVRESDGKTVSSKDGRIVAAGNDLKKLFPNTYRNADNTKTFHGKLLNLGEAFKLACLVQHGPNLPIEMSGHSSTRSALFRTAAYYALSDEEVREIMDHPKVADFF